MRLMDSAQPAMPVNIGNPEELPIRLLVERIVALTGTISKIVERPLPEDDPSRRRPDISRAKALLDWEPRVKLEQGLEATIRSFEAERNRLAAPITIDAREFATAAE